METLNKTSEISTSISNDFAIMNERTKKNERSTDGQIVVANPTHAKWIILLRITQLSVRDVAARVEVEPDFLPVASALLPRPPLIASK